MCYKSINSYGNFKIEMSKASSDLTKKTVNHLLDFIRKSKSIPMVLPSERILSDQFEVSRSTLIRAFQDLEFKRILRQESRSRLVLRLPEKNDYYQEIEKVHTKTEHVENYILEKFSKRELLPGNRFSELQIAKEIEANTVTVREVLLKISSTGLIKKKPRKQWEVIYITADTVNEITDYRQILEIEGLKCLLDKQPDSAFITDHYGSLLKRHESLLSKMTIDRKKIVLLESDLHKGIISHTHNRFINDNYNALFIVIRYHLGQHNMTQNRFRAVLQEHIKIIKAIMDLDYQKAVKALKEHFIESKQFFFLANQYLENKNNQSSDAIPNK